MTGTKTRSAAAGSRPDRASSTWINAARRIPYLALLAVLFGIVIIPVLFIVATALTDTVPRPGSGLGNFTLDNFNSLFTGANTKATTNSVVIGVGGTLMALVCGGGLAWLAARTDVPSKGLVRLAGITPLFMSSLVGALAWGFLASPRVGYFNLFLREIGIDITVNVYSVGGMVFVFGLYYTPYAFLLIHSALALMNPELEQAAAVHGANNSKTARIITLPLIRPAILGASLLTFVLIVENFPIPQILGTPGNVSTLPSFIFRLMRSFPPRANQAAAVGLVLLLVMSVLIIVQRRMISSREYTTVSGKGFRPRRIALGRWRWPALGLVIGYMLLGVVLPVLALLVIALRDHTYVGSFWEIIDPSIMSLDRFAFILGYQPFQLGLKNSLITGLAAAVVGGLLHLAMSYTVYRTSLRGRSLVEHIAMLPLAVPSLVLGMGMFWTALAFPIGLYGTLVILALAYTVRFMPQGFRAISSSILQIHPELEESARTSGASRFRSALEVTIPLLRTGIFSTMMLLFIISVRELSAAIFLFPSDTRVLSVVVYDLWDSGRLSEAAALSLLYSAVLLVVVLATRRWMSDRSA